MLRRHMLAPIRGLVLFGLSLVGFAQLTVMIVSSFTGVVLQFEPERWLPNLCRDLTRVWLGVQIPRPYRPKPAPPERQPDGWYREGDQLYKKSGLLRFRRRTEWLQRDPATHRDHLWALLTPVTAGVGAALPAGLIALGAFLPMWATIPLVAAGFAIGPAMLAGYARWTAWLLRPADTIGRPWCWVKLRIKVLGQLSWSFGMSLTGVYYAVLTILAIYPGILALLPQATRETRRQVNLRRKQIGEWTGVRIDEPYLPYPPPPTPRPDGKYQLGRRLYDSPRHVIQTRTMCAVVKDKATWRDLAWLVLDPVVAFVLGAGPAVLAVAGFVVYFWSWVWSRLPALLVPDVDLRAGWAYLSDLPGLAWVPNWATPIVGLVVSVAVLSLSRPLLKLYGLWGRLLLAPTKSATLARRVAQLTESRTEATDAQAAELRRIERDLHDGAQARWVAMGLNLGAVEQLIDQDPDAAKRLLADARSASAQALVELRHLVRGIHPPVLAERGLGDAIRAMALDSALTVHVAVDLPGQVPQPIEAAVYFSVNELLTNVAKHARAQRTSVDIRYHESRLRVTVVDDGHGGADPAEGSGLLGVRKRLATFDGELTLSSPSGGPTVVTMEVPCALSSPKTSPSSEMA
ncbi:sensor histidine kinase [Actinocrispum wychmicini]|uniref:histidine kinase n=1 Tax=Actinocrispum wychmicini TaxID=1213861 RepID=A0A4R2JQR1_9PSEU|nr:histidine kinase [Actinocrispum wychmicini]TCO62573.1 signal transduction histidine kinase [Actinocrispum wychmicini]